MKNKIRIIIDLDEKTHEKIMRYAAKKRWNRKNTIEYLLEEMKLDS